MIFDSVLDHFRGKAVTIPPMDGALKPNNLLEEAEVVTAAIAPDNLALLNGKLIYTSGAELRQVKPKKLLKSYESDIASLAVSDDGRLAVGLDDGTVLLGEKKIEGFTAPAAMAFDGKDLLVCDASAIYRPSDWAKDLMRRKASGSIWRVDAETGTRAMLADGLAYPNGIIRDQNRIVVSESWTHRLIALPIQGGRPQSLLPRLPAYPSRLARCGEGYLLCLFAPLNRLVEFVLQENQYREDMMREIDSRFWIAPTLSPASSFLEPLQNGGVRSMGVHKPWSPTRSYGLIALLDRDFQPVRSFHSRASGRFHGVTSALYEDGAIIAASKGGNHIVRIPLEAET